MAKSMAQPSITMLLQMRQVNICVQNQRIETEREDHKAHLDYADRSDSVEEDEVDVVRRNNCFKALEPLFQSLPTFAAEHKPHKDLIVTYTMAMAVHGDFADDYTELKKKIGALHGLPGRAVAWSSGRSQMSEVCSACKSTDLIIVEHEARKVCRSCGIHIETVQSTDPEKFNYEENRDRTHHGDALSPFLTAHGQTQGGQLEGAFADAQRRVDERCGQNHNLISLSTMDAHINRAANHLKNDLPLVVHSLFETNQAMFNTALHLFATKRKMSHSLHEPDKWLAAAVILAIIQHLEVRKASSSKRNNTMCELIEASRKRLLSTKEQEDTRLAEMDETGVRRFLFDAIPNDDVERVVCHMLTVQKKSVKFRPLGALLGSTAPGKLRNITGFTEHSVGVLTRMTKKRHRDETAQFTRRKHRVSSQENIQMVLQRAHTRYH